MFSLREFPVLKSRTPVGLVQMSIKFRVTAMNSRAEKLFGTSFGEARKKLCRSVCPFFQSEEACGKCVAKRSQQDGKIHKTLDLLNDNRPMELTGFPVRTDEGILIGSIMSIEDLSAAHGRELDFLEKDRLFQTLWNEMKEGVFIVDSDGAILNSNPAAARQMRMGQKTLRERNFYDLLAGDAGARPEERLARDAAADGFKPSPPWPDGAEPRLNVSTTDLTGPEGRKLCVTLDRTARKRMEQLSRFYRKAIDMAPNQVVMLDERDRIFYVNKSVEKMTGKPRQDLIGQSLQKALEEGGEAVESFSFDKNEGGFFERPGRSGASERYALRSLPVHAPDGARSGSVVTAQKVDDDLRMYPEQGDAGRTKRGPGDSREFWPPALKDIFNHLPAAVFVQAHGTIVYANTALCNLLGSPSYKLRERGIADFLDEESRDRFNSFLGAAKSGDAPLDRVEIPCKRPFPHNKTLRMNLSTHPDSASPGLLLIGVISESSQKREFQAEDFSAPNGANETAVNNAWDLLEPLQNLTKTIETFRAGQWSDSQTELARDLSRVEDLVKNILASHQPDYHKKKVVFLNKLVERSLPLMQEQLDNAKITVKLSLSPYVKNMVAAPQQILGLCAAMLERAVEVMPSGGKLLIESRKRGDYYFLEFHDNGMNVSGAQEKAIFGNRSPDPHDFTTGSSLLRVKNIVEQHGGAVKVRTSLNKGTQFTFILPLGQ